MIVREIVQMPELLWNFDYFNDSKDTISHLRSIGQDELADKLKKRADLHFAEEFPYQKEISIGWSEFGLNHHTRESGNEGLIETINGADIDEAFKERLLIAIKYI